MQHKTTALWVFLQNHKVSPRFSPRDDDDTVLLDDGGHVFLRPQTTTVGENARERIDLEEEMG